MRSTQKPHPSRFPLPYQVKFPNMRKHLKRFRFAPHALGVHAQCKLQGACAWCQARLSKENPEDTSPTDQAKGKSWAPTCHSLTRMRRWAGELPPPADRSSEAS